MRIPENFAFAGFNLLDGFAVPHNLNKREGGLTGSFQADLTGAIVPDGGSHKGTTDFETEVHADIHGAKNAAVPHGFECGFTGEFLRPETHDALPCGEVGLRHVLQTRKVVSGPSIVDVSTTNDAEPVAQIQGINDVLAICFTVLNPDGIRVALVFGPFAACPHGVNFYKALHFGVVSRVPFDTHLGVGRMVRDEEGAVLSSGSIEAFQVLEGRIRGAKNRTVVARVVNVSVADFEIGPFKRYECGKPARFIVVVCDADEVVPLPICQGFGVIGH